MGRPKKSESGPVPTRERLLHRALELFAVKGFDAVSVRDITRSLGLNEATLYIHYKNKSALLDAILGRLEERLIEPGFRVPSPESFSVEGGVEVFGLANSLIEGARRFFSLADRDVLLTWRMLMISQFRYESARRSVEEHLLNAPVRFLTSLLRNMQTAGRIRREVDCEAAGRIAAALFFDYSFRSNLKAAWDEGIEEEFDKLAEELRVFAGSMENV